MALKLYHKLDETTGTLAVDSSGSGHNGTLQGTTFDASSVAGHVGRAVDFNGLNRRVFQGDLSDFKFTTGAFSLACWFNTSKTATTSANGTVLFRKKLTSDPLAPGYLVKVNAGKVQFFVADSVGSQSLSGATNVNNGADHFMACTMSASKVMTVYVDDLTPVTVTHTLNSLDTTEDLMIGSWGTSTSAQGFDGWIDEARIYNHELSAAEVDTIYRFTGDALRRAVARGIARDIARGIAN